MNFIASVLDSFFLPFGMLFWGLFIGTLDDFSVPSSIDASIYTSRSVFLFMVFTRLFKHQKGLDLMQVWCVLLFSSLSCGALTCFASRFSAGRWAYFTAQLDTKK
jgi:hypothetical protein